ncbi:MAG: hypothetical protein CME21_14955 [Gemmatimonadetes bacterium]|nr:hypothetical protein [Gemmatimonadota bacterium]
MIPPKTRTASFSISRIRNARAPISNQPNIIWIMCDQMRFDAAGFAGNEIIKTPVLDKLAEQGVVFENAYCASPVCSPARASWLTGLYPHAHMQLRNYGPVRGTAWGSHLPSYHTTIGDVLKREGYRCGMVGPWHLGNDHKPQHGFDDYWQAYRYLGKQYTDPLEAYFREEGVEDLYRKRGAFTQHGNTLGFRVLDDPRQQRTTWTVDHTLRFLDQTDGEPFFAFVSIKDPHPKMLVPQDLLELYPADRMPIPATLRDNLEEKPDYHKTGKFRIPESVTDLQVQEFTAYYYALVTHIDSEIGRIVSALETEGLLEDTILVFMSDHGELLGDHGYTEKCFMYESSVRVPCLLHWPGGLPPQRVRAPLGGVDLMPTLTELSGSSVPTDIDGQSVAKHLRAGEEPVSRPVFAEIASQETIYRGSNEPEHFASHVMMLDGSWKYVRNRADLDELYDLASDPEELRNLASLAQQTDRVISMRASIARMVGRTGPGPYAWCLRT